jgi:iron complex transport system substrate-binding protein
LCALAWLLCATLAAAAPVTVNDDRGRPVTLAAPAQRIVALAPAITELIYAAGAGGRLVGAARYSDFPPAARSIPQIGDSSRVDVERMLALKPDLVVGWKSGNPAADIERIERLGFKVFVLEPRTLSAIPSALRALGALAGDHATAGRSADEFERRLASLRERYAARSDVRVFYEIWHEPLMTVNGEHMISDVIRLCGGSNVFATVPVLTPVVSVESVLAARPEVVLGGGSSVTAAEFALQWARYRSFAALRDIRVAFVNPDWLQRQTPRIIEGARAVCERLEEERVRRMAK